ncbi:hypothetical protein [Catenisphaera adipataccumulans]|jgi:hypothetical protein|uniref:Uncharacterized protein n=1 Tax=Catenisphaera adipataccumulans TaxID=700500 RepID=A0A7W8FU60_9FIRM|nr:hypothetical protein [Catenisphaera adipataccumulans]MBB5182259.1 hypothetical protein [Catenisphaera adipataccumulans]
MEKEVKMADKATIKKQIEEEKEVGYQWLTLAGGTAILSLGVYFIMRFLI